MNEIQGLIDAAVTAGQRGVSLGGFYSIDTPVVLPPSFTLEGVYGPRSLTIQVPGTAALPSMINATGAMGSRVRGITLKGNRGAGAVDSFSNYAVLGYDADDLTVEDCIIQDIPGSGAYIRNGKRPRFMRNVVDNVYLSGFTVQPSAPGGRSDAEVSGNAISRFGMHSVIMVYASHSVVRNNHVKGVLVRTGLNMAFDGSLSARSLSGAYFDSSAAGRFVITAGGWERLISAVLSPTIVQMSLPLGPILLAAAGWGNGDILTLQGVTDCVVDGNKLEGGASLGISIFSDAAASCDRNSIINNRVIAQGSAGISLQNSAPGQYVRDTLIAENDILDCGLLGAAGDPKFNVGIAVQNNNTFGVRVIGNSITGYSRTMEYPVSFNRNIAASLRMDGFNQSRGCIRDWTQYDAA